MVIVCFALFFVLVAVCLIIGRSVAWALLGGVILFWLMGRKKGFTHRQIWAMAWDRGKKSLMVVIVIALIGMLTGLWRISGTIAYCIVMGMELITPRLFLLISFLLCLAFSYVLGTSFGVASTLGVILMALARSGGVDPVVTAGVILSGIYFGDRCSPASSAAILVATVTDTDLYSNVRQMLRTAALPTALCLVIYAVLSWLHPITGVDAQVLAALRENFSITALTLLPAAIMFLLPLFKVPIKIALIVSSSVSAVLAVTMQNFSLTETLSVAWGGFHPQDSALAGVLSGGGITSMFNSNAIVMLAGLATGILNGTGTLESMKHRAHDLANRIGRFPAMVVVSVLCASILCNQAVTSMLSQQLMDDCYEDRNEMAQDIENSGVVLSGLIPWSVACSIPLAMMGVGFGALVYACFLWLLPPCYFFTKKWFYPGERTPKSVENP